MSEYTRRWRLLFRTPVVWKDVFVAYFSAVVWYYISSYYYEPNVAVAIFLGLILAASASTARILKMERKSQQQLGEQERAASEPAEGNSQPR
jgi:hypothetical protein